MPESSAGRVRITVFGGPTALIEYGGLRLLTDPTFDEPGPYDGTGEPPLTKTAATLATPESVSPVDAVLLSHDQHVDNLDTLGRAFLGGVPITLTTPSAASRLGGSARALAPWSSFVLPAPGRDDRNGDVTVTAVPAQHGPDGSEPLVGEVTGFVLTGRGSPSVYVSGDNASLAVVQAVADRFGPVDTAILFAGAVRRPLLDGALLTLDSEGAAEAARILGARRVVPAHVDGWAHFTENRDRFEAAFAEAGLSALLAAD